jgi:hypothetical protein
MKASINAVLLCTAATLAWSSVAPVAVAETLAAPPAPSTGRHCVVRASAVGTVGATEPAAPECFDSFAAAISFATDGTVRLPAWATTVTQAQLDTGRATDRPAATVIGIESSSPSFGGTDWIISQANGCNDGGAEVWVRSDLTGNPMNNAISSAQAFAGCKSRHFDLPSFAGSSILCGPSCSSMGTMDNRTTSIRWSATGF